MLCGDTAQESPLLMFLKVHLFRLKLGKRRGCLCP